MPGALSYVKTILKVHETNTHHSENLGFFSKNLTFSYFQTFLTYIANIYFSVFEGCIAKKKMASVKHGRNERRWEDMMVFSYYILS